MSLGEDISNWKHVKEKYSSIIYMKSRLLKWKQSKHLASGNPLKKILKDFFRQMEMATEGNQDHWKWITLTEM